MGGPDHDAEIAGQGEGLQLPEGGLPQGLDLGPAVGDEDDRQGPNLGFDEEVMREIAQLSGGAYFRATDTKALENIYRQIDELEKTQVESRTVMIPYALYRWPLALALLALLALGLFPMACPRRLTRSRHA